MNAPEMQPPKRIRLPIVQNKLRGVIIPDACFFNGIAHNIPNALLSAPSKGVRKHPHYFDMLTFTADHGVQVLIPEMVALEVAGVFADGKRVRGLRMSEETYPAFHTMASFFADAALPQEHPGKRHRNIQIVPDTGPAQVDEYITRLKQANQYDPQGVAQLYFHKRPDYGDQAILALAKDIHVELNVRPHYRRPPVFVISDDINLTNTLKNIKQHTLTITRFVENMMKAELHGYVGIKPETTFLALEEQRRALAYKDKEPERGRLNAHKRPNQTEYRFEEMLKAIGRSVKADEQREVGRIRKANAAKAAQGALADIPPAPAPAPATIIASPPVAGGRLAEHAVAQQETPTVRS